MTEAVTKCTTLICATSASSHTHTHFKLSSELFEHHASEQHYAVTHSGVCRPAEVEQDLADGPTLARFRPTAADERETSDRCVPPTSVGSSAGRARLTHRSELALGSDFGVMSECLSGGWRGGAYVRAMIERFLGASTALPCE